MNVNNNTAAIITWQHLLHKTQFLAARFPCKGISPDKLASLPFDALEGTYNHLKVYAVKCTA